MTQLEQVRNDLRAAGPNGVCSSHWYASFVPNSRNRIGELEHRGFVIERGPCKEHEHATAYFRYRILVDPDRPTQQRLIA